MNRIVFSCLIATALAACGAAPEQVVEEPPLAGATIGGPFALVDHTGKDFTEKDLLGKYALVYFGYSYCPDICPVDMQRLTQGLNAFAKQRPADAARVQPIFVTVDPERDTPQELARFVKAFHPRLVGLTGTPEQIKAATKAYAVSYRKQPGSAPDAYLMAHSQLAYLMDPEGKPVALLPFDDPSTPADEGTPHAVAAELARWVRPAA